MINKDNLLTMNEQQNLTGLENIIDLLRRERKLKGITQQQLAERVGLQKSNVCRFERKTHSPSLSTIDLYMKALGVKLSINVAHQGDLK
jgi:transcriptional regulator with XRE-family HTH domain